MELFSKDFLGEGGSDNKIARSFQLHRTDSVFISYIELKGPEKSDVSKLPSFIWTRVTDFLTTNEDMPLQQLKSALVVAKEQLLDLIKHNDLIEKEGLDFNMSISLLRDNTYYFAMLGDPGLVIYHENELVDITGLLEENDVNAGSTEISPIDIVIHADRIITNELLNSEDIITENKILKILENQVESDEDLAALIFSPKTDFNNIHEVKSEPELVEEKEKTVEKKTQDVEEKNLIEEEDPYIQSFDSSVNVNSEAHEDRQIKEGDFDNTSGINEVKVDSEDINEEGSDFKEKFLTNFNQVKDRVKALNLDQKFNAFTQSTGKAFGKTVVFLQKAGTSFFASINNLLSKKYGRSHWYKKMQAKISQSNLGNISQPNFSLGDYKVTEARNKRVGLVIALVLVSLVGWYGYRSTVRYQEKQERTSAFNEQLTQINDLIDNASATAKSDPENSLQILSQIEQLKSNLDGTGLEINTEEQISNIEGEVLGIQDDITKTVALKDNENINLLIDARVSLGNQVVLGDISIFQSDSGKEFLVLTDSSNGLVYQLDIETGDVIKLDAEGGFKNPVYVDVGENGVYVYDTEIGFLKATFTEDKKAISTFSPLGGLEFGNFSNGVDDIAAFTETDNLYALSAQDGIIYKANSLGDAYGVPFVYIEDSLLNGATDFFADFSVYTLADNSGIKRFTYSAEEGALVNDPIQISGVTNFQIGNPVAGYTAPLLTDPIVVFDKVDARLIVLEKPIPAESLHPGKLVILNQYTYRGESGYLNGVKDLVVNRLNDTVYILDGNQVLEVKL